MVKQAQNLGGLTSPLSSPQLQTTSQSERLSDPTALITHQIHSLCLKCVWHLRPWDNAPTCLSQKDSVYIFSNKSLILLFSHNFSPQKFFSQHGNEPKYNLLNCLKNVYGCSNIKKQGEKRSHSGWYYIPMELLNLFIFHVLSPFPGYNLLSEEKGVL